MGEHDPKLVEDLAEVIGDDHWWECDHFGGYEDGCKVGTARAALDWLAERGRLLPPGGEVSTQWAAKVTRRNGVASYMAADDRDHAVLIAECIETHIASLNGPTFAEYDVKQAEVVHRTTTTWPDGSQYVDPWEVVSDNSEVEESSDG